MDAQRDEKRYPEEYLFDEQREKRRLSAQMQQRHDEDIQSILNWRKRSQEPLVHTDFGYEVPPMRK